jgi:hypothetical protein
MSNDLHATRPCAMREIACRLESVVELRHALVPTIVLGLRVSTNQPVSGIDLRCQILIDVPDRAHSGGERSRLAKLYSDTAGADAPLRPLLWAHANANAPAFDRQCNVDLTVPVSFDFDVVVTKYLHGFDADGIPLRLRFSGMIFYRDAREQLQLVRVPGTTEAGGQLPLRVVQSLRDRYYPNSAWLRMPQATFDRLRAYKQRAGLPSWESALDRLLDAADEANRITERAR